MDPESESIGGTNNMSVWDNLAIFAQQAPSIMEAF